jgi:hypothetical protein
MNKDNEHEVNTDMITLEQLESLTGFPKDYLKQVLNLKENFTLSQLKKELLVMLNETFEMDS